MSVQLISMFVLTLFIVIVYERKCYNYRCELRNLEFLQAQPVRQAEMDAWVQKESTPERAEERIAQYLARNPRF
jgi:hypothetical protein